MGLSTIETGRGSHPGFVIIPRQGTRRGRWDPGLRALDRGNGPAARTGQGTDGAGAGGGGRWVRGWPRLCDKGEGQMFVTRCSREWGGGLGKTYRAVSCILPSRSLGRAWEARDRDPGFTADVILCLNLGPPHPHPAPLFHPDAGRHRSLWVQPHYPGHSGSRNLLLTSGSHLCRS